MGDDCEVPSDFILLLMLVLWIQTIFNQILDPVFKILDPDPVPV